MNQEEKLDYIISELQYLTSILQNDPKTGKKGMVAEFADLKEDVEELKTKDKVRIGQVAVAGTIFGIIGSVILKAAKFLF